MHLTSMHLTSTAAINPPSCGYCGAMHSGVCPRVKEMEYFPDGRVKRVAFHEPKLLPFMAPGSLSPMTEPAPSNLFK